MSADASRTSGSTALRACGPAAIAASSLAIASVSFAESAHVKDALAFLRVVSNPSDTLSWFRTLKLLDHVGDATVNQILEHLGVERREFRAAKTKEALFRKLHRFPAKAGNHPEM